MGGENRRTNLNTVLGREEKPVFHHGAEAQNFYFLQPLDAAVAMIVPNNRGLPPSILSTGEVKRSDLGAVLASLQAHGYLVVTNPLFEVKDPHINGHKLDRHSVSDHDLHEWKDNVALMRTFLNDLHRERGTAAWTSSVEFDFNERRMWEECIPPRDFVAPAYVTNATKNGAGQPDDVYATAKRHMSVCAEQKKITQIPTQCQRVSKPKCGTTVATVGRCKFRHGECSSYNVFPQWGKIEFENCNGFGRDKMECDPQIFQWCRRVPADESAHAGAGWTKIGRFAFFAMACADACRHYTTA